MSHPQTAAVCAQPRYEEWARKNRGSIWDYTVEGETELKAQARRRYAVRLCNTCPLKQKCLERHHALVAEKRRTIREGDEMALVGGIWGGRIYKYSTDITKDPEGQESLMPRNDLLNDAA